MGKKTSYAKLMELTAQKRGKFEKQLQEAERRGDRFGINSAQRSIARLEEYEQEIFDSQEQQKVDKGITPPPQMAYGGLPKFVTGGPTKAELDKLYQDFLKAKGANTGRFVESNAFGDQTDKLLAAYQTQMANGDYNVTPEFYRALSNAVYNTGSVPYMPPASPDAYGPFAPQDDTYVYVNTDDDGQGAPIQWAPFQRPDYSLTLPDWVNQTPTPQQEQEPEPAPAPRSTPRKPRKREEVEPIAGLTPKAISLNLDTPFPELMKSTPMPAPTAPEATTGTVHPYGRAAMQGLDALGKVAPYALQFAPDLYALNQLKTIEGPVDAPFQRATQINTDIDTSATRAQIQDNMRTFNAGVDANMSNSAAVQNVKLANLAQTNRQMAAIGQQEANQESGLRNQQASLLTQNFNNNMGIDAANRQRMVDFNNMITNARLGIVQGMGTKALQINQEKNRMDLDRERLDVLSRQFDQGRLLRNFQNMDFFKEKAENLSKDQMASMAAFIQQYPAMGESLKVDNPDLYNALINLK